MDIMKFLISLLSLGCYNYRARNIARQFLKFRFQLHRQEEEAS